MKLSCPNSSCLSRHAGSKIVRDGTFYRPSDGRRIQRFKCSICEKRFSRATFSPCYRQNKRRVNHKLEVLLCSSVSQRRAARILKINIKTVAKKLAFLAMIARKKHQRFLESYSKITSFQFDDLHTSERTKCLPVAVTLMVETNARKILGFEVSKIPASGHLAALSKARYGRRKDERQKNISKLFQRVTPFISKEAHIISDQHPYYPELVQKYFAKATYTRVKGRDGCIAGQGELKKVVYDPLFSLNHTCAMLRANINRLIRKTWCTSKKLQPLADHIAIYINYHNQVLT